jgi:hypothetical protein
MKGAGIKLMTAKREGANMKKGLVLVAFAIIGGILASYAESARADEASEEHRRWCEGMCRRQLRVDEAACQETTADCLERVIHYPVWLMQMYTDGCMEQKQACETRAGVKETNCVRECVSDPGIVVSHFRIREAMKMWEDGRLPSKD